MKFTLIVGALCFGLFIGMLVLLEVGRRYGERRLALHPNTALAGTGVVDGTLAAFLGLLIAFTFSAALLKFEDNRKLTIEEANAINDAYERLEILPARTQPALRTLLKEYTDIRLETFSKLPDIDAVRDAHKRSVGMQDTIWRTAVEAATAPDAVPAASLLVLPAIQDVFSNATARIVVMDIHPPVIIYVMLFSLALSNALLLGIGMAASKNISWLHAIGFAGILAGSIFIILDIEYPNFGIIRINDLDQVLHAVRAAMD